MDLALETIGYDELREEQERRRAPTASSAASASPRSPRSVGAGPRKDYDIIGIKMNDCAELRVHPTGKAILKISCETQGQGHETTFAQIVAEELGIQPEDIKVMHGDTDNTPYGLGTYASRSTPASAARRRRWWRAASGEKATKIAAHLLEVAEEDIEFHDRQRSRCRARPTGSSRSRTSRSPRTRTSPTAWRPAWKAYYYYDPPNLTFPFGTYAVAVEVDPETGVWKVQAHGRGRRLRRAHQPDDRRGPDPRRAHRGLRHRRDAADHVRRGRQLHRLELHGLPAAHRVGDAQVRAGRDRDAVAAPPDRREGRRRVGHGRLPRRVRERGDRRAAAARRAEHRHAAHDARRCGTRSRRRKGRS